MYNETNFDHRPTTHIIIERKAGGGWHEHARFADVTDAESYVNWRREHYGAIFAAVGYETMIVGEPNAGIETIVADGTTQARPTPDQDMGDGRVARGAWSKFDS